MRTSISNARQVVIGNFELTFSEIQRLRFLVLSKSHVESKLCGCKIIFLDNFFTNISAYLLLTIVRLLMLNMSEQSVSWFNPDELSIVKNYMIRNNYEFLAIHPDISKKLLAVLFNIMGETDHQFEDEVNTKLQQIQTTLSTAIETNRAEDHNQLNVEVGNLCSAFISYIDSYIITLLGLEINCKNLDDRIISTVDFMKRCKGCKFCRVDHEPCPAHTKLEEKGIERVTFVFGDNPTADIQKAVKTINLLKEYHTKLDRIHIIADVRLINPRDCLNGYNTELINFLVDLKKEFPIKVRASGKTKSSSICIEELVDKGLELL